jgi:predicted nucleic acid-binding Zn ribbon protein
MPEPGDCLKCGGSIPEARRADSRYCSESCKLASEYERRRIERRLADLEAWQDQAPAWGTPKQELRRIQERIDAAEARLKVLLGG